MYGAIIGDLAGSIYEFDQTKEIKKVKVDKLINKQSFYSDDTILTIAILDAIKNDKNYSKYLKQYINKYKDYKPNFSPYFKTIFSSDLIEWACGDYSNNSIGNGAMMRISPIGYMFNSEEEIIKNARLATIPSHNTKQSVDCATIIALMIYYFRNGMSKKECFLKLHVLPNYEKFEKFNKTCYETINNCLTAIFYSNGFEDAIKKVLLMGGDTDTNACIVGSVAEALYGIDEELKFEAEKKLPSEFVKVLKK